MARISLDQVQSEIAALVDQDEVTTNISATDYSLRLKFINMALHEWAEVWDWQVLQDEYNCHVSTSTGNASVVLPSDFRKLSGPVEITYDGTSTANFEESRLQEDTAFDATFKRVCVLGNPKGQYILRVFGATLSSGASVKVPYLKSVQSLVSPANIAEIPNPDYLTKRTVAYLWEAREDPRYPGMKDEAEKILRNMIEFENIFGYHASNDRAKTVEETTHGFRLGRD